MELRKVYNTILVKCYHADVKEAIEIILLNVHSQIVSNDDALKRQEMTCSYKLNVLRSEWCNVSLFVSCWD